MMNKIFSLLAMLFIANVSFAQIQKATYSLEFNEATCQFEVFANILEGKTKTVTHRAQLNSQVTLVTPANTNVMVVETFNPLVDNQQYRSEKPADWEVSTNLDAPATASDKGFHSITPFVTPTAFYQDIKAGDKVKLFALEIEPMVDCASDVRLFDNVTDPKSSEPGMKGADFRNGFTVGAIHQSYAGNTEVKLPASPQITSMKMINGQLVTKVSHDGAAACQGELSYEWYGYGKLIKEGVDAPSLTKSQIETGNYSVVVTDKLGCKVDQAVVLDGSALSQGGTLESEVIIEQETVSLSSSIYPNPAKDFINLAIEGAKGKLIKASILSVDGKVMRANVVNENVLVDTEDYKITLEGMNTGIYHLSVTADGEQLNNHKMIIVK